MRMAMKPNILQQMRPLLSARTPQCVVTASTSNTNEAGDFRIQNVAKDEMRVFWKINQDRKRPVSPWTIYKPELTSMLSLQHRLTGIGMGVLVNAAAIALFVTPQDFTTLMTMLKDLELNPAILFAVRFIMCYPLTYHYINGIRHLAWDAGKGFPLKEVYKTGKFVQALAICVATGIASLPYFI